VYLTLYTAVEGTPGFTHVSFAAEDPVDTEKSTEYVVAET